MADEMQGQHYRVHARGSGSPMSSSSTVLFRGSKKTALLKAVAREVQGQLTLSHNPGDSLLIAVGTKGRRGITLPLGRLVVGPALLNLSSLNTTRA